MTTLIFILTLFVPPTQNIGADTVAAQQAETQMRYRGIEALLAKFDAQATGEAQN